MKVIIAGGRNIKDKELVLNSVIKANLEIDEVVCGMAHGVDLLGKELADEREVPVEPFPADWIKHGKAAGPIRNKEMAEYADALILIWDGKSKGSANMKKEMKALGKPIYETIVVSK